MRVAIGGVDGYVGQILLGLVQSHPCCQLVLLATREGDNDLAPLPSLRESAVSRVALAELSQWGEQVDVLFLATPPAASMASVAAIKNHSLPITVIDLSGAFRLSAEDFAQWYGMLHQAPELLPQAEYGLSPWNQNLMLQTTLIANPGCYATAALMALLPIVQAGIVSESTFLIDAKSGVTGAGKKAVSQLMFCEIANNFYPYKIGQHQHTPEIETAILRGTGKKSRVLLTTHMLPIPRGISLTIYAEASSSFTSDEELMDAMQVAFDQAYKDYALVEYAAVSSSPSLAVSSQLSFLLSLKNVVGTPKTHISYFVQQGKIILFCCIDNLLKGAASQAIENLNAVRGLPLTTGLIK